MGDAEWYSNVDKDGLFKLVDRLPKYRWFVEHIDNIDADLYFDYGADYFFLVRDRQGAINPSVLFIILL